MRMRLSSLDGGSAPNTPSALPSRERRRKARGKAERQIDDAIKPNDDISGRKSNQKDDKATAAMPAKPAPVANRL